jgi:hypothetical protein
MDGSQDVRQVPRAGKEDRALRRLALAINDPLTIDRFNQLISDTKAEKVKLHPEQEK